MHNLWRSMHWDVYIQLQLISFNIKTCAVTCTILAGLFHLNTEWNKVDGRSAEWTVDEMKYTSCMRCLRWPISSGSETSLLLLTSRTCSSSRRDMNDGITDNWLRLQYTSQATVRDCQSKETSMLWSDHEETRELPGKRDNARNSARCTQARKTMHGLDGQHQDVDRTSYGRVNQNDS